MSARFKWSFVVVMLGLLAAGAYLAARPRPAPEVLLVEPPRAASDVRRPPAPAPDALALSSAAQARKQHLSALQADAARRGDQAELARLQEMSRFADSRR